MESKLPLVAVASLLLLLSACGGGDDPSAKKSSKPVNVCDLISAKTRAVVDPSGVFEQKLSLGEEEFVTCGATGTVQFEYGVAVADGASVPKPESGGVKTIDGFGDSAVTEQQTQDSTKLRAKKGDAIFLVRNDTLGNSENVITLEQTKQVLKELLDKATPAALKLVAPVALGRSCPPADDSVVTSVIGTVAVARGGEQAATEQPECQYLGKGGTRIDMNVVDQKGAEKDFLTGDPYDRPVRMKGAKKAVRYSYGPGTVDLTWSTGPDTVWFARADPLIDHVGKATTANVQDLGRAFMKRNAAFTK